MRKKRILLRFVEAMDFVDEHDGPRAVLLGALRVGHDLLDFFDPDSTAENSINPPWSCAR
jgi:hypothetical protein